MVRTTNGTVDGGDHEFTIPYDVEVREERASNIAVSEATLSGEVNPVGVEARYYFEYGTTEAYGSNTAEASAGSGNTFAEVTAAVVAGLEPGTLYHFRIVASSARGTTVGEDKEFETHGGKPVVETLQVFDIGYTEALIRGRVGRKGAATTYYFDYGTTEAYGQQTPEEESERPEEDGEEAVLGGLTPGTLYHYRIVATNSYGTSYGADRTFSTGPEPLVETEAAEAVSYDAAALRGAIDPHGAEIDYYFEYGTTDAYGQHTVEFGVGSGMTSAQETQSVSGLAEDSTYHFRIVAKNSYGTAYGSDRTFSTGVKPSVPLPPPVEPIVTPPDTLPPLVEPIVTPPNMPLPPIVGPAPSPIPVGSRRNGPSLRVAHHGHSLLVVLELDRRAARVEIDATVSPQQLSATKPRGRRGPLVLARQVHATVDAGRPNFLLSLDAARIRELGHRHLRLTVTVTITSLGGARQKISRMLSI